MKKILLYLFVSSFMLPVIAVCHIDKNGACISQNNTQKPSNEFKLESKPVENQLKTEGAETNNQQPYNSSYIYTLKSPDKQNYDADCQFGICLPKKP